MQKHIPLFSALIASIAIATGCNQSTSPDAVATTSTETVLLDVDLVQEPLAVATDAADPVKYKFTPTKNGATLRIEIAGVGVVGKLKSSDGSVIATTDLDSNAKKRLTAGDGTHFEVSGSYTTCGKIETTVTDTSEMTLEIHPALIWKDEADSDVPYEYAKLHEISAVQN